MKPMVDSNLKLIIILINKIFFGAIDSILKQLYRKMTISSVKLIQWVLTPCDHKTRDCDLTVHLDRLQCALLK